jgi:chromosome segregation ATPase
MNDDDPITLRRAMDDTLRNQMQHDRHRIDVISERLNRVEVVLENISSRFDDHEEAAGEIQNRLIGIAEKIAIISTHFKDHMLTEEEQWRIVNKTADTLHDVTKELKITEHRVSNLDRMMWAIGGFILSGFGIAVAWVISHLEAAIK